jgi:hypothetical protein
MAGETARGFGRVYAPTRWQRQGRLIHRDRGNHDAESRITRELTLPESVKFFARRAEAVPLGAGRLDVACMG